MEFRNHQIAQWVNELALKLEVVMQTQHLLKLVFRHLPESEREICEKKR